MTDFVSIVNDSDTPKFESNLIFLNLDQMPRNRLPCNQSPEFNDRDSCNSTDMILKCQFCNRPTEEEVYQYLVESEGETIGHHYLCAKCQHKGVRFCQFKEDFFLQDILVQLDDGPVVHQDLTDIIETYMRLPDWKRKNDYLKMCGLDGTVTISIEKLQ